MAAVIECLNLTKSFGRVNALQDLSLEIQRGEPIGLVGPNGAGKTTLFSLIAGFLKKNSGELKVMGLAPQSNALKGKIGVLPQDSPFLTGISIQSQLKLFAELQGMPPREARQETERVLNDFSVIDLKDRKAERLSHGQRKRVALAQALIGKPQLALLDEPTAGLDPIAANDVRQCIQEHKQETTFIISSHNLDELENLCQTIVLIDQGQLVISSTLAELTGQDNHLSVSLNTEVTDELLIKITALPEITKATVAAQQNKRLQVEFNPEHSGKSQKTVLKLLEENQYEVMEFSRGRALSERIIRLIDGRD